MGVVAAVVGTLAMSYLNGRAQQKQYNAAAQQAEANAQIAENNARKTEEAARIQDQNNKLNEEEAHRRNLARLGQQRAAIGASGITATGSALNELVDSRAAIEREADITSYNNRQGIDSMLDKSNDYGNQANMYNSQASSYRRAGRTSFTNSIIGGLFQAGTMASSLYSSGSAANAASAANATSQDSYGFTGGPTAAGKASAWSGTGKSNPYATMGKTKN